MDQIKNPEISKGIFQYLRISLISGMTAGISIILCFLLYPGKPVLIDVINLLLLLIAIPGYLILPGIIYKPFVRNKALPLVPLEQIFYYAITVISLGIIPSWIYFTKYDSRLNSLIKGKAT